MNNPRFTQGKWRKYSDAQGPIAITHPIKDGVVIAILSDAFKPINGFMPIESPGAPERTANFNLLFAAPKMYAACKLALDALDSLHPNLEESEAGIALKEAIRLAEEGEQS